MSTPAVVVATPPPGFVRHPDSGCIIPEGEVAAHELAMSSRRAHHSRAPIGTAGVAASVDAKLAELAAIEKRLDAKLAASRAALGDAPETAAEAPAPKKAKK